MDDTKTVHVRPKEGLHVRNPATGAPLPEEGATVPLTTYWRRRIEDGDALASPPKKAPAKKPAAKAATKKAEG